MNETSWIVGYVVAGVVVVIVVLVALAIIKLATDIRDLARQVVGDLERAEAGTAPLWHVGTTNQAAEDILLLTQRARERLGG
ncbi:MAG: hypothetical protein R3320_00755 [Nitriliruptorales bacterium]|nr:hypothetical protein [Nitriliruptorales bacterium]